MITKAKTLLLCGFCLSTIVLFLQNTMASTYDNSEYLVISQSFERGFLSRKIWDELLYENKQRKNATRNKEALTYPEVVSIIGQYPTTSKNGKYFWIDETNGMTIIVRFHKNQIADMKGKGF